MSEIYFIRHGQASFGSENYDNLSELGHQQSKILGNYLKETGVEFDRVVTGTLNRQQQTCENIIKVMELSSTPENQSLLNEYDVKSVLSSFVGKRELTHGELYDKKEHFILLRSAVKAWSEKKLDSDLIESWSDFQKRGSDILNELIKSQFKRTLVISSGGTISMIIAKILELPSSQFVNFHMQIFNTGFSKVKFNEYGISLTLFNSVAHLESFKEPKFITHV